MVVLKVNPSIFKPFPIFLGLKMIGISPILKKSAVKGKDVSEQSTASKTVSLCVQQL